MNNEIVIGENYKLEGIINKILNNTNYLNEIYNINKSNYNLIMNKYIKMFDINCNEFEIILDSIIYEIDDYSDDESNKNDEELIKDKINVKKENCDPNMNKKNFGSSLKNSYELEYINLKGNFGNSLNNNDELQFNLEDL